MFELETAQGGGFFWRLRAENGEILCHSEVYTSRARAEQGIAACKRVAPSAGTRDLTGE